MGMTASSTNRVFTTGNAMTARAAIDAGCRFFAGYPITPASQVYTDLTRLLPACGGVAMAAPDEISSLSYVVGASLRGTKAMTATSGPGYCLMVETMGYALMTETPLVVVLVQRLGPSTGAATQGAQGDIHMVMGTVSGGYAIPVFAPSTAAESYEDTLRAFEWSERLRTPVVLLSDKEVASTSEVVDLDALPTPLTVTRPTYNGDGPFVPYGFETLTDVPAFAPVGGAQAVTVTGSAHDKQGNLRKNDPDTLANLERLEAKIQAAEPELGRIDFDEDPGADTLVLSYGVSARASRDAVAAARAQGLKVSLGTVRTLFPLPRTALAKVLAGIKRVIVPEENFGGQYRYVLQPLLGDRQVIGLNRVGGLIKPQEILDVIGQ